MGWVEVPGKGTVEPRPLDRVEVKSRRRLRVTVRDEHPPATEISHVAKVEARPPETVSDLTEPKRIAEHHQRAEARLDVGRLTTRRRTRRG
jgi:hypothetical protein